MIIVRTPHRISLYGGSCDYKSYYSISEIPVNVIGFAITKYSYIICKNSHKLSDYLHKIYYSVVEKVNTIEEIQNDGIRGCLQYFYTNHSENILDGLQISIQSDLPARCGMGSSSALVVGLTHALYQLYNLPVCKYDLTETAIEIERNLLNEPGGIQDQIWSSHGGIKTIKIDQNGGYKLIPWPVSEQFLDHIKSRMILLFLGQRQSFDIAKSHDNDKAFIYKNEIQEITEKAYEYLKQENDILFFNLLINTWKLKRKISKKISNDTVNSHIDKALSYGSIGCKLLGTGGSGFILCYLKDSIKRYEFCCNMDLPSVDFDFDLNGSTVIHGV